MTFQQNIPKFGDKFVERFFPEYVDICFYLDSFGP